MALTKNQIVDNICYHPENGRNQSIEITESLLEIIKLSLESGEEVLVSGFGKFCVCDKRERLGRNPATNGEMMFRARRVVTFKCSGKLRERVNG